MRPPSQKSPILFKQPFDWLAYDKQINQERVTYPKCAISELTMGSAHMHRKTEEPMNGFIGS
jgi:hypothetical protein